MAELIIATVVFLISHGLAGVRPLRAALVARLSETGYMALFSAVSLGLVIWLGVAYARADYVELWPHVPALRWVPLTVMPVACVLIVAGLSSRNPFSLGAGANGFDPARPGIVRLTRHPAVWGLVLWSLAHIPVNGDAASLVLFGLLSLLGIAGPVSLDAKRRRAMGPDAWTALAADVQRVPPAEAIRQVGALRAAAGLALYGALLYGHETLIGISPLPV